MKARKIEPDEWNVYFMNIATAVKTKSKDPSTKVGAVIIGPDNEIRSTGFNGFPKGVCDNDERYADRETKLKLTEHAERNAIFFAAKHGTAIDGCTIYIAGLPPCAECARAIIQAGIKCVVVQSADIPDRWKKDCEPAFKMLEESGVDLLTLS